MWKLILLFTIIIACQKDEFNDTIGMAKQTINIGTTYRDPSSTPARDSFDMCNDNFTELYNEDAYLQSQIDAINTQVGNSNKQIIEIGVWNMDSNGAKEVNWTLPANKSIRTIFVIIFTDSGTTTAYPLNYADPTTGLCSGGVYYGTNSFLLHRLADSFFDSNAFDGSANRGYITVEYDAVTPA